MAIQNQTLKELKELCKKNNFKNYSNLNKIDLIKFIKKNMKGGDFNYKFNGVLNRESLLNLLKIDENKLRTIIYLNLSSRGITSLEPGVFDTLSNLENINLMNNNITTLKKGVFDGLSSLKNLTLFRCNITTLDENVFDELNSLETLDLSVNNLKNTIKPETFNRLSNLRYLYLKNNYITRLEIGTFNGLSNLSELNLSNNNIILKLGVFEGLINLRDLYLINNKITKIETGVFDGLYMLNNLFFWISYSDMSPEYFVCNLISKKYGTNIRLYNKYFNLYQKCTELNGNKYKQKNNGKNFNNFYDIFKIIYNKLRDETYININKNLVKNINYNFEKLNENINIKSNNIIFTNNEEISNNNIMTTIEKIKDYDLDEIILFFHLTINKANKKVPENVSNNKEKIK